MKGDAGKRAKELGVNRVYGMVYGIEGFLDGNIICLDDYLKSKKNQELLNITPSAFLGSCRYKLPSFYYDSYVFYVLNILCKDDNYNLSKRFYYYF